MRTCGIDTGSLEKLSAMGGKQTSSFLIEAVISVAVSKMVVGAGGRLEWTEGGTQRRQCYPTPLRG
jgi:hypothetical protein